MSTPHTPEIVVAGGGLAALEFVLALRALAGDRVHVTLIAPNTDALLRPELIAGPLGVQSLPRHTLASMARDVGFELVPGTVSGVRPEDRRVLLRGGGTQAYDTLVLAPGARRLPAFDGAIHLGDPDGARGLAALREEVLRGEVTCVAFVAPTLTGWLLPLYEAALLTAGLTPEVEVTLVSAEERPLALFGADAGEAVAAALSRAGVRFLAGRRADVTDGVVVARGKRVDVVPADRIVSCSLVRGPQLAGVPETGVYGLIPVDGYGRVHGLPRVYAIGDATDFPIKQGGLACQQADAAAEHIAAHCGAPVVARPFTPVLQAVLLTGGAPIVLGEATEKLPGRHLAPYLAAARGVVAR